MNKENAEISLRKLYFDCYGKIIRLDEDTYNPKFLVEELDDKFVIYFDVTALEEN